MPEWIEIDAEILAPLGMTDTWLGLGTLPRDRVAQVTPGREQVENRWPWNSDYWRDLAAPWGGLHATARDYGAFLEMFLHEEARSDRGILSGAIVDAMSTNQVAAMPGIGDTVKAKQAWGLGWLLNQPRGSGRWPKAGSPRLFGHTGATACMAWADPDSGLACVLLTTQPHVGRLQNHVSKAMAALAE